MFIIDNGSLARKSMGSRIARHWQFESFSGFKKCVRQCYRIDKFHFRIINKFRINVKKDWHIHLNKESVSQTVPLKTCSTNLFVWVQLLCFKAKTLNFIKILSGLKR